MRFFWQQNQAVETRLRNKSAMPLVTLIAKLFTDASADLNQSLLDESLRISVDKPFTTSEESTGGEKKQMVRLSAANAHVVLSIRAIDADCLEAFILPAPQYMLVPASEYPSRLRFKLIWSHTAAQQQEQRWTLDSMPISLDDLQLLVLASTNDIIKYSNSKLDLPRDGTRLQIGQLSLTTGLRDLLFEKAQLISDLLSQQEKLQSHLAEELHDSAIADLMILKRAITSGGELDRQRLSACIDDIAQTLREICTDFSSTDVKNWGLWHALGALAESLSERVTEDIALETGPEPPKLPYDVELQIYRIVQESLNNAIKHAGAAKIKVSIECRQNEVIATISDDGVGFKMGTLPRLSAQGRGGMGLTVIKERAEHLAAVGCPATVTIESTPGGGTRIQARVDISSVLSGPGSG